MVAATALAGLVKGIAVATGTTVSELTGTYVAADAALEPFLLVTALGLLVGLPAYLLATHVFVQRPIERATGDAVAAVLATLIVGAVGPSDLLDVNFVRATTVAVLAVIAIALPAVAATTFDRRWLTAVTAVPLAIVVGGVLFERIAYFRGIGDAVFALAEVAVVAIGVVAYQRTNTLLPSALTFATFFVATDLVVIAFEAGVGP